MHQNDLSCDQRRCGLNDDRRIGFELVLEQVVEACRVELAERKIVRVRKIDDRDVERFRFTSVEPDKGVAVRHVDTRVVERVFVQFAEGRNRVRNMRHIGIEIDDLDELDRRIFLDLAKARPSPPPSTSTRFRRRR